jgi:hypothetical protein
MLFSLAIIFEAFQWTNLIHVGGGGVVRSKSVSASRNFTSFCKLLQKLENKHLLAFVQKKVQNTFVLRHTQVVKIRNKKQIFRPVLSFPNFFQKFSKLKRLSFFLSLQFL